jgi:hypothetical protein
MGTWGVWLGKGDVTVRNALERFGVTSLRDISIVAIWPLWRRRKKNGLPN